MNGAEVVLATADALEQLGIAYMVVGSFSSNSYGVPRSTQDADFVIDLAGHSPREIADKLGPKFYLDPQSSFEGVTMTTRYVVKATESSFKIELFLLSDDPHDQERFRRRRRRNIFGHDVFLPTAEDVIITKLHWATLVHRKKDLADVAAVIAVQRDSLDWNYIHHWTALHGSRDLLDEIRRSIP
jgi:hypothetical protein